MDAWTFVWLMVFLKIPIAGLLGIVWWAVKQTDDNPVSEDDGGSKHIPPRPRHPHRPRLPHAPRRGPHGGECARPPVRTRTRPLAARARHLS